MKFESNHYTNECTKTREELTKCANSSGNHSANFKGCQIFNDILNHTKNKVIKIKSNQLREHSILITNVSPANQINIDQLQLESKTNICETHSQHTTSLSTVPHHQKNVLMNFNQY